MVTWSTNFPQYAGKMLDDISAEWLCSNMEAAERLRPIPTILITAYPDDRVRERALGDGVVCYLIKPFDENDLLACIQSSLSIGQK
jgi:CheY-like chemotaxis protein